jgi:2-phosphosulfolactate phosphatase
MKIQQATLATCSQATGTVVAIDVIRAFTTAAFAFAAGAQDILLVGEVEEALALRQRFRGSLAMGEVGGRRPDGFDLGNSPSALMGLDLRGRRIIQRTSAGTQGVVRSLRAEALLAGSFVCAGATVRYLQHLNPASVTFVVTGAGFGAEGDEDAACADYAAMLLQGETPDIQPFLRRVRDSTDGRFFAEIPPRFSMSDLDCCLSVDRFDFAMVVERMDGLLAMKPLEV